LRADGQVVLAPFETYAVEVVPAFRLHDGRFVTANTPMAEAGSFPTLSLNTKPAAGDLASDGKATHLTMMAKAWNRECNVALSPHRSKFGFCIAASDNIATREHSGTTG